MNDVKFLVSYIVPAFNAQLCLESCVNSIISIGDAVEVIIINDGSLDDTESVAKRLVDAHPNQVRVINQENKGVSIARNTGIKHSLGAYIAFCDADDTVNTKEVTEIFSDEIISEDLIMFTYTSFENGRGEKHGLYSDIQSSEWKNCLLKHLLWLNLSENNEDLGLGGKVFQYFFKREFLENYNITFKENLKFAEDLVFCSCAVSQANSFKVIDKSLYNYYVFNGTAAHRYRKNHWHELKDVYKELLFICPQYISKGSYFYYARVAAFHVLTYAQNGTITNEDALTEFAKIFSDEFVLKDFLSIKNVNWSLKEKIFNLLMRVPDNGKCLFYYLALTKQLKEKVRRIKFRGGQKFNRLKNIYYKVKLNNLEYQRYILRKSGVNFGKNVCIYDSYIDPAFGFLITIGNNVTITNSKIYAHDASTHLFLGKSKVGHVKIGNNVFIGANSIIMPNITIGDAVIVSAGTIVTHNVESNTIVAGNPAKVIGYTNEFVKKHAQCMRNHPVWDTYWQYKDSEEKELMRVSLQKDWGYDE